MNDCAFRIVPDVGVEFAAPRHRVSEPPRPDVLPMEVFHLSTEDAIPRHGLS